MDDPADANLEFWHHVLDIVQFQIANKNVSQ